jgi:hypothetical protein
LIAVLDREVAARNASGAQLRRTRAAGFPAHKTFDEFVFDHQPGIRRDDIAPLAAGHYLAEARNVVLLGPPGTGKPTLRSLSASPPATPGSESCSTPPPTGSPVSKTRTNATGFPQSSPNSAATD